jgi:M6 family metalloprotease-like protein
MKKIYLALMLLATVFFAFYQTAVAVPAWPHPIEYQLPDGTTLTITLKGDEKVKWAETIDGYTILLNSEGFYEYTVKKENGDMERSGIRAYNPEQRTFEQHAFLSQVDKKLHFSSSQVGIMKQIWEIKEKEGSKSFPTTGNRKLIAILIGFTDKAFTKTQSEFNDLFNTVGYTTGGATGSVKDYYMENSYNQFNLTVDVAGPYTASNNMAYYGANNASGYDVRPRELVTEAVNLANPHVNYAEYDNDNDGSVDGVYIIYAGYGEEAGGGANAIWAHAWTIPTVTLDGKTISRYSCSAELRGSSGTNITRIGVICHEFGHVLGAPDYYDTNYETGGQYEGTGQWDMMAGGSWNNGGATPAHHNGFTKVVYYEWAPITVLSAGTTVTLNNAAQNSNSFYRINTTTTNEYYLIENREKHLFDAYIPGSGMMIYHVHSGVFSVGNAINATHPQRMYPVAQNATSDPTSTPSSYGSINSATCAWTGAAGTKTQFTDATLPSMKSWAGANTNKPITNISRNTTAKTVTFDFMGGAQGNPTNFAATAISSTQINLSWTRSESRDVLLVFNTTSTIGTPASSTNYSAGNTLPGGGTVIYAGGNETFSHSSLNASTTYYYKVFTKLTTTPTWSTGVESSTSTMCDAVSLPFTENFNASTSLPGCWSNIDNQGSGQVWQFGTHGSGLTGSTGNYAYLNSDAYGSGNTQNADLITPTLNLVGYTNVTLNFKHYYRHYDGSSAKLYYSINNGANWTQIQSWTANSTNPATFNQVIAAVANQAQVQFKWNYTGSWGYYWDIDDVSITGTAAAPITVNFGVIGSNGTLTATVNGQQITTGAQVQQGNNVVFTASPASQYRVKEWKLNNTVIVGNTSNSYTVNSVSSDVTVNVEFEAIPTYEIIFSAIGTGTLAASVGGNAITSGAMVVETSNVLFTATPGEGHRIKEWKRNNAVVAGNTSTTYTVLNLSENVNVTVEFEAIPAYQVTFSAIGTGTLAASVGGNAITSGTMVVETSNILFTASPGAGQRIKEWKLNNAVVADHTAATYTVSNLSGNVNVIVEFEAIPQYTLTITIVGEGTVEVQGNAYTEPVDYIEGFIVNLEAIVPVGIIWEGWSGDINSDELTLQVTMNQNISLTATFRDFESATINPSSGTFDENNPTSFTTVITWNDATEVVSISTEDEGETIVFVEGDDYTVTDINGTTALLTFPWGEKKAGRTGRGQNNYILTIEFDFGNAAEYLLTYIWIDYWTVTFTITGGGQPLSDVSIEIDNEQFFTDEAGQVIFELEDGNYTYTISKDGWESTSGTVTVDGDDQTVDIELISGLSTLQFSNLLVYPNPASQTLNLERQSSEKALLEIFAINGRLVYSIEWESTTQQVDLESFENGVYQIRVTGNSVSSTRFLKK